MADKVSSKMAPTLNGIPAESREKNIAILNQALADLSDLYSQAKQAHWNVRGADFYPNHLLFDQVAESVEGVIDDLAERVVQLGGVANGTVRQVAANSKLPEISETGGFIYELAKRFALAANSIRASVDATAENGDTGSSDLLTGISRMLDKALWFLEAHTRE